MKSKTTLLVLGVAIAVVAGLFSSTIFGLIGTKTEAQSTASASGLITGHVTAIVTDAAGNIKEYRQTDNLIVNQGENCVLKLLFASNAGDATGNNVCTGENNQGFRYIGIGNGSAGPLSNDDKLYNPHNSTSFGTGSELIRKFGTITWTNSTGTTADNTGSATAVISATFTNGAPNSQTVSESGLFNETDGTPNSDALFARQTFNAITLNNGDSLTVQWTVNVGGTGSFTIPP